MKSSGIEWIGNIPDDWEVKKLKYVAELDPTISEFLGDNDIVSFAPMECLGEQTLSPYETEYGKVKGKYTYFANEDIIMAKVTPCFENGNIAIAKNLKNNVGFGSSELFVFRAKNISNSFLMYSLYSEPFKSLAKSTMYGTGGLKRVSPEFILNYKIPFPPLKTQEKIADYLDEKCGEIDATITKQKESIEKLKAYKQSLISETVTKGLDKSASLKPSGIDYLGDIPSHWEIKKLKFVANFNQNTLPEDTDGQFELKYIDIGNVSSVDGIKEIQYFNFSNAPSRARRIVKYGDIIVSTVRTYLRAITSIKEDYDNCICSTGFAVITPKDNVQQDFVVYAIENESFIAQIIANSQGISYPAINVSQLENLKLAFPSIKKQKEIVDFLKIKLLEIDSTINKKQNIIQKLDAYKKSLIFECVTGKHKIY